MHPAQSLCETCAISWGQTLSAASLFSLLLHPLCISLCGDHANLREEPWGKTSEKGKPREIEPQVADETYFGMCCNMLQHKYLCARIDANQYQDAAGYAPVTTDYQQSRPDQDPGFSKLSMAQLNICWRAWIGVGIQDWSIQHRLCTRPIKALRQKACGQVKIGDPFGAVRKGFPVLFITGRSRYQSRVGHRRLNGPGQLN